jgi:hypothetical protein
VNLPLFGFFIHQTACTLTFMNMLCHPFASLIGRLKTLILHLRKPQLFIPRSNTFTSPKYTSW